MRNNGIRQGCTGLLVLGLCLSSVDGVAEGAPVAGLEPSRRPDGAPVLESVAKGLHWYQGALTGIAPPYPYSLRFLEDQGAWYTPFVHPGMTGPYDIRGWHQQTSRGTAGSRGSRAVDPGR